MNIFVLSRFALFKKKIFDHFFKVVKNSLFGLIFIHLLESVNHIVEDFVISLQLQSTHHISCPFSNETFDLLGMNVNKIFKKRICRGCDEGSFGLIVFWGGNRPVLLLINFDNLRFCVAKGLLGYHQAGLIFIILIYVTFWYPFFLALSNLITKNIWLRKCSYDRSEIHYFNI